jgi:hypothetical protein
MWGGIVITIFPPLAASVSGTSAHAYPWRKEDAERLHADPQRECTRYTRRRFRISASCVLLLFLGWLMMMSYAHACMHACIFFVSNDGMSYFCISVHDAVWTCGYVYAYVPSVSSLKDLHCVTHFTNAHTHTRTHTDRYAYTHAHDDGCSVLHIRRCIHAYIHTYR